MSRADCLFALMIPSFLIQIGIVLSDFLSAVFGLPANSMCHEPQPDSSKVRALTVWPQRLQSRPLIPPANHLWTCLD